jgi:photosystem II stability/assembly factor-like uncharacterized protein
MKKIIQSILCCTLTISIFGQVTFQTQTTGTTQNLKGTTIIPGTTRGWAAGTGGTILYTADGGTTWTAQSSGVTATLEDISWGASASGGLEFVWACGSSGTALATSDAGTIWEIQSQGAPYNAYAIDFQNISNGIFVGDQFYATSSNGGNAWTPMVTTDTYYAVDFVSATTGWVCGPNGIIRKTTNGGTSWSVQTSGTTSALHGIFFLNANEGWACGITGTILKTTDGGTTWLAQVSNTANLLSDIQFTDSQNGWACGYTGTILRTTNGGTTWTMYHSGNTATTAWLQSIALINANEGWAVGDVGTIIHFEATGSISSITEVEGNNILCYPNPTTSLCNIEMMESTNAKIITILGETVLTQQLIKGMNTINVSELTPGVYFVQTENGSTIKFIKE